MTTTHTPPTTDREEWLTVREACALIGVSPATLRRWSNAGEVRTFTTPGGHRRFARSSVLGLLPAAGRQHPRLRGVGRRRIPAGGAGLSWIADPDDRDGAVLRDHGRRIAGSLVAFADATTRAERERNIRDACSAARECGRIAARRGGMTTTETVAVLEAATGAIDLLLAAVMSGYDAEVAGADSREAAAR